VAPRLAIFWHEWYQMNTAPKNTTKNRRIFRCAAGDWGTGDGVSNQWCNISWHNRTALPRLPKHDHDLRLLAGQVQDRGRYLT